MRQWLIVAAMAVLLLTGCDTESMPGVTPVRGENSELYRVVRVVDGDTIIVEIDGREERVRYIGIDAPESVRPNTPVECFGIEASDENKRLVDGTLVELERDVSDRDRFDRLLRYVYIIENGERVFVNEALVAGGFAHSSTFPPDVKHQDTLRAAQREARDEQRGLWRECAP